MNKASYRQCTYQIFQNGQYIGSVVFQSGPINSNWLVHKLKGQLAGKLQIYDSAEQVHQFLLANKLQWQRKPTMYFYPD